MTMISFYPGPSQVYPAVPRWVEEACRSGILYANHRSGPFMDLMARTRTILGQRLEIPDDYTVAFVSSATECWEIVAQSLVRDQMGVAYSGAFGRKWATYAGAIVPNLTEWEFGQDQDLPVTAITSSAADVVGLVHNETSNGTVIPDDVLIELRQNLPQETILAVDATSSLGGVRIDFTQADVWFASVQKCLGLPAGMAILILSPRAVDRAYETGQGQPYNALTRIVENAQKHQAHHTPNILDIYLLYRSQETSPGIEAVHAQSLYRYQRWEELIREIPGLSWLIHNEKSRSRTVMVLKVPDPGALLSEALQHGLILGRGYGPWQDSTIRIANFPAITEEDMGELMTFLRGCPSIPS